MSPGQCADTDTDTDTDYCTWWHSDKGKSGLCVILWCAVFTVGPCAVLCLSWNELKVGLSQLWHITRHLKTIFRSPNSPASHRRNTIYQLSTRLGSFLYIPVCFTLFAFTLHVLLLFTWCRTSTIFHQGFLWCSLSSRFPTHCFYSSLINTAVNSFQNSHWVQYRDSTADQPAALN